MVPCVALIFLAAPLTLAIDADYQPYGDFYYAWYSGPKNFTDAENYCHGWSGTLTSVHSDGENAYVASRAEGNQLFWVGAEHPVGGDWSWTDGSAFDYNEFQGTVNSNVCVSIASDATTKTSKWVTSACNVQLPLVCMRTWSM